MNQEFYRILFSEVINGFTLTNHSVFGQVFIKHFSYVEVGQIDSVYNTYLETAEKQGIPTYKEREKQIIADGFWTQKEEDYINDNEKLVTNLKINISKDYLPSRRKILRSQINEIQKDINKYKLRKDYFIGQTAEHYANKKLTFYKIINSYFKDVESKEKLIQNPDEEIRGDESYYELISLYNKYQEKFDSDNMRMLSISPFFTSIFYLSSDDAFSFYGKPIVNLTNYQADLYSYARYYKSVISQFGSSIPNEIKNNPEELSEWVDVRQNATEQKIIGDDNQDGGGGSIVGANSEDLKILGIVVPKKNPLFEELKKKGGTLNKDDLFRLTG